MLKESIIKERKRIDISRIQKSLFFTLFLVLPFAIIPFPWDWTEKSMSLIILIISTLILGLELIKFLWNGKVTLIKSALDIGLFSLLLSFTFSTLLSKDFNTSFWGIDGRLGGGLLVFIAILITGFCARTFLASFKDLKYAILSFLLGMFVSNILSLLSFVGVNTLGFVPMYKEMMQVGLPFLRSAKVHILLNYISIFMYLGLIVESILNKGEKKIIPTLAYIMGVFSILNIWLYSINQGFGLLVTFILCIALIIFFGLKSLKLEKSLKKDILLLLVIASIVTLVPTVLLQIPSVRSLVIPSSINLVAQVSLGTDVSWIIAASTFVDSLWRGLLGMGVDTYTIAYNLYKPLNQTLLAYNDVNFYYAGTEIFTKFANGGLIWILSWGFIGFLLIKTLVADLKIVRMYKEGKDITWFLVCLDFISLFIFLSSFFTTFNVLTILIFVILFSFRTVIKDILSKYTEERFVVKLWAVNVKSEMENEKVSYNLNVLFTVLISCLFVGFCGIWITKGISSLYLLKAESFLIQENRKYSQDAKPTVEEREATMKTLLYYYSQASKFDKNDPVANRKGGLIYLEMVGISSEKYAELKKANENTDQVLKDLGKWKNYAIDYTRKSIDTDPFVYSNWESRAKVYLGLMGIGFNDYTSDALYSLDKAIELNPLNFTLYYNKAQIYVVNGSKDDALGSLTSVLRINPQHIPSMILAGEINKQKGNMSVYESYMKAAKKVLEIQGNTNTDIYKEVTSKLNEISQK